MAAKVKVRLGKGISKYKLPNGVTIKGSSEQEVDYSPNVSRAIKFGDLELISTEKPKKKEPLKKNKTGEE